MFEWKENQNPINSLVCWWNWCFKQEMNFLVLPSAAQSPYEFDSAYICVHFFLSHFSMRKILWGSLSSSIKCGSTNICVWLYPVSLHKCWVSSGKKCCWEDSCSSRVVWWGVFYKPAFGHVLFSPFGPFPLCSGLISKSTFFLTPRPYLSPLPNLNCLYLIHY